MDDLMSDIQVEAVAQASGLPFEQIKNALFEPPKSLADLVTKNGIQNGLESVLGLGGSGIGFPFNERARGTNQLSQTDTIFVNLRYYLISNFRQILSEAYVELGLVQTICCVPVDDALRGGIEIRSKQLSEDQIIELLTSLDRDDDLRTVAEGGYWMRLYGGGGIIILTDQDPREPLVMENITNDEALSFRAVDMWELFWDKQNEEGYDPTIQADDFEYYNYYGVKIHKSRVMRLKGLTAPSFIRPRLRGWGFSVVETLVRSINQYLKATDLAFEVLDEFKVDVFKIKNLVNTLLSPNGEAEVRKRVNLAAREKNYNNALTMDSEDDWDHKQLSFSGLGEAMKEIRMQVAADMRMPLTKLFGISASGFNSGEDDIEVYNAMVEGQVRNKIKYPILRILEIKCQKLFGMVPDDLAIDFKPLREMSAEQEENVKTQKYARLQQAKSTGELNTLEYREACNKGNLFDITLDTTEDALMDVEANKSVLQQQSGGFDDDAAREGNNDPETSKDTDDPGANRADTQKSRATELGGIAKGNNPPKAKEPGTPGAPKESKATPEAKEAKQEKKVNILPQSYNRTERLLRIISNSADFDKAAYEADGGDSWIDPRRKEFFSNPGNVDEALWAKAKEASEKALGEDKWQFVTWWYKKQGGKFS